MSFVRVAPTLNTGGSQRTTRNVDIASTTLNTAGDAAMMIPGYGWVIGGALKLAGLGTKIFGALGAKKERMNEESRFKTAQLNYSNANDRDQLLNDQYQRLKQEYANESGMYDEQPRMLAKGGIINNQNNSNMNKFSNFLKKSKGQSSCSGKGDCGCMKCGGKAMYADGGKVNNEFNKAFNNARKEGKEFFRFGDNLYHSHTKEEFEKLNKKDYVNRYNKQLTRPVNIDEQIKESDSDEWKDVNEKVKRNYEHRLSMNKAEANRNEFKKQHGYYPAHGEEIQKSGYKGKSSSKSKSLISQIFDIIREKSINDRKYIDQHPSNIHYKKDGGWIQKATASIKRRGTEGVCTGTNFGGSSCPPGSKRYTLAQTFRKMANARKNK